MAGENLYYVLYGAPYIEEVANDTNDKQKLENLKKQKNVYTYDDKTTRKQMFSYFEEHEGKLKDNREDTISQIEQVAQSLQRKTLDLFENKEDLFKEYMKALNTRLSQIDRYVQEWVNDVVDEITKNIKENQLPSFSQINEYTGIRKQVLNAGAKHLNDLIQNFTVGFTNPKPSNIKKALKTELFHSFISREKGAIAYNRIRPGGAKGELTGLFSLALANMMGQFVNKSVAIKIKNIEEGFSNTRTAGSEGGKADLIVEDGEIILPISIKLDKLTTAKLKNTKKRVEFIAHNTVQPHKLLDYINTNIDPSFEPGDDLIKAFNTYWVNMRYIYGYGYRQGDRDIRNKIDALFAYYGTAFLALNLSNGKRQKELNTYFDMFQEILDNAEDNALFLYFPGYGVIPIFELFYSMSEGARVFDQNGVSVKISYGSNAARTAVDEYDAKEGILINNIYYSRSKKYDQNTRTLLEKRYDVFSQALTETTISIITKGQTLEGIFKQYGGYGFKS